jgi:TonB family protein
VVLFPWNPALWLIARQLHLALELDCDERVIASGAEPLGYGRLLLSIAQHRGAIPLAPTLSAPVSHLERRIIAMETRRAPRRPLQLAAAAATLMLGVAGACSSAAPDAPPTHSSDAPSARSPEAQAGAPMLVSTVEQPPRQIIGTGTLRYPDAMRRANREGIVQARFVVDENGVVDVSTFKTITSSDTAFTEAVRAALPTLRFHPALSGGKRVKQVVEQPFTFGLQRRE